MVKKSYAIATAPQFNLFAPHETWRSKKIRRGSIGLSQTVRGQNFPAIELIQAELNQIPADFTVAPALLDEAFTKANIEQQLASQEYSAIHWKTHGIFSSDPQETYVVAYTEQIESQAFNDLILVGSQNGATPLQLVVLSACETALGSAQLGNGVEVLGLGFQLQRVGAKAVVASLWQVSDRGTQALMTEFYAALEQGLTKTAALQAAQRALIANQSVTTGGLIRAGAPPVAREGAGSTARAFTGYSHPYYWAPFILIGNGL